MYSGSASVSGPYVQRSMRTTIAVVSAALLILLLWWSHRRRQYEFQTSELLELCSRGSESQVFERIDRDSRLLDKLDKDGWNCLINASKHNRVSLVKALLKRGASTGTPSMRHSALRGAALFGYDDVVTALINAGAYVDVYSAHQRTPLMGAAMNGHLSTVKLLLRSGANPVLSNDEGETARDLAKAKGHDEIVQILESSSSDFTSH